MFALLLVLSLPLSLSACVCIVRSQFFFIVVQRICLKISNFQIRFFFFVRATLKMSKRTRTERALSKIGSVRQSHTQKKKINRPSGVRNKKECATQWDLVAFFRALAQARNQNNNSMPFLSREPRWRVEIRTEMHTRGQCCNLCVSVFANLR